MTDDQRPLDYVAAAGLAMAALLVRAVLDRWLGSLQPYSSGFVVIAAAVWFLGWKPAALTAILCYVGGSYLFVEPRGQITLSGPRDIAALLTFLAASAIIISIGQRARTAERALARANAELREVDRRKDVFLATLSHELRNPLGVIMNAVTLLAGQDADPRTRTTLAILSRQAAHMRRLIDDLLDVGRIARGRMTLREEIADLRTCIEHAVDGNRHAVSAKQQTIVVELPPAPVNARVDGARVVQVVSNLIDNASKYSPEGSEIRVHLAVAAEISIEVSDNGPGIDDDMLPRVFDLFEQGGGSPSGGLGLGLGLCKRLVEMHGGSISAARNTRGSGTTFCIRLPRPDARLEDQAVTSDARSS